MTINVEVELRDRENVERLIRRFVKKVKKEGILEEYRNRQYFEKKSDVKRAKKKRQKRIARERQREQDANIGNNRR